MAVFSKRAVLLLLLTFVLLSVAFRYPLVEHERHQTDSYFIHMLSGSIVDEGYAKWVFHPLSLFGYYPFSYPSGTPFLVAELAELTGVTVDVAILLSGMMLSILFCLAVFFLARHFFSRSEFVLLVTLLVILGPRFIDTTYWDGSARGYAVVMMTLAVAVLLRVSANVRLRLYPIAAVFVVGCFMVHHMAVLLVLVAIGYLIASVQVRHLLPILGTQGRLFLGASNVFLALLLFVASFFVVALSGTQPLAGLAGGSFFDFGPEFLSVILVLASSYTNQIGFILPVAVLGIPMLFLERRITMEILLPITILIAMIPVLGNSLYVSMIAAPYVVILGVSVISRLRRKVQRRRLLIVALSILVVGSFILPAWSVQRWNQQEYVTGDKVEVDHQLYSDGAYLSHSSIELNGLSNVNAMSLQLAAVSGTSFLGPGLLMPLSDDVDRNDVRENIAWSSIRFPLNLYKWFEHENESQAGNHIRILMIYGLAQVFESGGYVDASEYFIQHPKVVVVVDNDHVPYYVDSYSVRNSVFVRELREATSSTVLFDGSASNDLPSYVFYQSEGVSLFLFEFPY